MSDVYAQDVPEGLSEEDALAWLAAEPADEPSPVKVQAGPARIERDNIGREDQKVHEDAARLRDGVL